MSCGIPGSLRQVSDFRTFHRKVSSGICRFGLGTMPTVAGWRACDGAYGPATFRPQVAGGRHLYPPLPEGEGCLVACDLC